MRDAAGGFGPLQFLTCNRGVCYGRLDRVDRCAAGLLAPLFGVEAAMIKPMLRGVVLLQGMMFVLLSLVLVGLSVQVRAAESPSCLWIFQLSPEQGVFENPGAMCAFVLTTGMIPDAYGCRTTVVEGGQSLLTVDLSTSEPPYSINIPIACQATNCPSDKMVPGTNAFYHFGTTPPTVKSAPTSNIPFAACASGKLVGFIGGTAGTPISSYSRVLVNGVANYYLRGHYEYMCDVDNRHMLCTEGDTAAMAAGIGSTPTDTCPTGMTLGALGGHKYCFDETGAVQNPNSPSNAVATVTVQENPGGGTTTVTTYPDGTVSTVVKDSAGNITGGTITPPVGSPIGSTYCQQNPTDPNCQPQYFSGACAEPFACSGDAVQCGIARAMHSRMCQLFEDRNDPVTQLGDDMIGGTATDADDPRSEENRISVDLADKFNVTPRVGVVCLEDDVFEIYGSEVRLPWSELCPYLDIAGQILVVLTLVMGMGIMFGKLS